MNTVIETKHLKKKDELEKVYAKLQEVETTKNYKEFYSFIKTTGIPFIPCYRKSTKVTYRECFRVLHKIGEISIPVSIALSMHYYILASLSSYPFSIKSKQYWKREILLKKIEKERLLIANTGSIRTFKDISGNSSILAQKEKDKYLINGQAPFMSLSGIADYSVFTATLPEGHKAVFFAPLDTNNIEFYDSAFGDTMQGSFTKSVKFKNLVVSSDHVIKLNDSEDVNCEILVYQRSWFQALIPSSYLGASLHVIKLLKEFSKRKIKNNKRLSESDNFLDNIGELMMKYKAAVQLCEHAGNAIADFKKGDQLLLEKMFETSVLSKHYSTHFSEEIVTKARHLMGSKFLSPNSLTNKIYKEIVYGPLQPMTDMDIKNHFSKLVMNTSEV